MHTKKTNPENQNIELGKVSWYRNYNEALSLSKNSGKPILLFFQEIPGCSTCSNFGRNVLSHPLMVEAIENEFIPLAIYNNKPGIDAEILAKYNEPSWNNPVAHFIDADGKDIIQKLSNNYRPISMLKKMMEALQKVKRPIPKYMELLYNDILIEYNDTEKAVFETPCFWSGETSFGKLNGVLSTQAGFIGSSEVVLLDYNQDIISANQLKEFANKQDFFEIDNIQKFRPDKDPQYYLKQSKYRYLPLSKAQRTIINYAIPYKENPEQYLSPKQRLWLQNEALTSVGNEEAYTLKIEDAWKFLSKKLN